MYTGYNFNPILMRSCGVIAITFLFMVLTNKQIQPREYSPAWNSDYLKKTNGVPPAWG